MGKFQQLRVWQLAKELPINIYRLTNRKAFLGDYSLRDQLRRASISVASNIAEGDELGSDKQSVRFFYISKGSAAELITQLIIANEIGYIEQKESNELVDDCDKISAMLSKLIRSRSL